MLIPRVTEEGWVSALEDIPVWRPPAKRTIIIAPHPDDETLGAGGLIAYQRRQGLPVSVVAVTDGEAAYSDFEGLAEIRRQEQNMALLELGVEQSQIIRTHLPDSKVPDHEIELVAKLLPFTGPETLLLAPWRFDFHPDHEACGRAAKRLVEMTGATLVSYVFWTWHHGTTELLTAKALRRLNLEQTLQAAKQSALNCHRSQLVRETGSPILPEELLGPAHRNFETFIVND